MGSQRVRYNYQLTLHTHTHKKGKMEGKKGVRIEKGNQSQLLILQLSLLRPIYKLTFWVSKTQIYTYSASSVRLSLLCRLGLQSSAKSHKQSFTTYGEKVIIVS